MSELVPLTVFALDRPEPADGWAQLFDREGVELLEDDIGRLALRSVDAARLLGAWRAEEAYQAEERARREAEQARKAAEFASRYPVARGRPAVEGLSAFEQMLLEGEGDERPRTVFTELLDAELAGGKGA